MNKQVWFVTGASKGLGLSLVKRLLKEGYNVAATSRKVDELIKAAGDRSTQFLPLALDLKNETETSNIIKQTVDHFGSIDVVVNNAGFGFAGGMEEATDAEVRASFDINVFGALNVIRNVLPQMRKQQYGHIYNISSIGGFIGNFPGFGAYCGTKFAVNGISESLVEEVKPFGIKVTIVMPGYFRTNFLDSTTSLGVAERQMPEYNSIRELQTVMNGMNGKQQGDPDKAAGVLIQLAGSENAPIHLILGPDAYDLAYKKMEDLKKEMAAVKDLATATNFDPEPVAELS